MDTKGDHATIRANFVLLIMYAFECTTGGSACLKRYDVVLLLILKLFLKCFCTPSMMKPQQERPVDVAL